MRCKNCDYRLWNLKSRVCPECGIAFRPSDFEFLANSVQFCCPHCNQAYYGTGEKGYLTPVEFECASCGRHIHMDETVLLPTAGIEEEQTRVDAMPWFDREKRGALRAWFSTAKMALVQPQRLMQLVPPRGSLGQALRFGTCTTTAILFVGGILFVLAISMANISMSGTPKELLWRIPLGIGIAVGIGMIGVLLLILLWALTVHGLLRLTGRTEHGLARTCGALCYSSAANIFSAIPCLGIYFGWIWWLVSGVLMVKEGQKVHGARASFAVVTMPLLTIATLIGFSAWSMSAAMSTTLARRNGLDTEAVLAGLLAYRDENGDWPEHAIEMVLDEQITSIELVAAGSDTQETDVPVADITLDQFMELGARDQYELADVLDQALPEDVVAHRLGDFVFTYHGSDPDDADAGLWLVIMSFDPAVSASGAVVSSYEKVGSVTLASSGQQADFTVGLADGKTKMIASNMLLAELTEQNVLRAHYGLAALPDPSIVLHGQPARAGAMPQPAPSHEDAQGPDEPAEDE